MTEPTLVEQLQRDAVDPEIRVSDLLRRAKLVSAKLGLSELTDWLNNELNGYKGDSEPPAYRKLRGLPQYFNPIAGWRTIAFDGSAAGFMNKISEAYAREPISHLEDLVVRSGDESDVPLAFIFGPEQTATIAELLKATPTKVRLRLDRAAFVAILDAVRNSILEWALKLEAQGIRGENFSFSPKEREMARDPKVSIQIGNIENLSGNVGEVSGNASVIANQTITDQSTSLSEVVGSLDTHLANLGLPRSAQKEAEQTLLELKAEERSASPNTGKVAKTLGALKRLLEKGTDKAIAIGINALIDRYLGPGSGAA